ncbi:MAG: SRPBCC family protein [Thiotrichales bacterium]|nr:SRPBCC family protein [Thiotrichales bacterium]
MNKLITPLFISLIIFPGLVFAHGPARVKVVKEIEINASPDKVWEIISDYCSIKDWHPDISECTADKGSETESVREITLANGEKIKEKLFKIDAGKKFMQYALQLEKGRIIEGLPVSTHGAKITVSESGGGAKVEWKGAFYRAFPGQNPPPEMSDETCKAAVEKLYVNGLDNIKKLAEQ